eukprot:1148892-Pelagomonas_calceolata.AAC.7
MNVGRHGLPPADPSEEKAGFPSDKAGGLQRDCLWGKRRTARLPSADLPCCGCGVSADLPCCGCGCAVTAPTQAAAVLPNPGWCCLAASRLMLSCQTQAGTLGTHAGAVP